MSFMKLKDALKKLAWPWHRNIDLDAAKRELRKCELAKQNRPHYLRSYGGYDLGISCLRAVVSLLRAADLVGDDNLPDVESPKYNGMALDRCVLQERWAARILKRTMRTHMFALEERLLADKR